MSGLNTTLPFPQDANLVPYYDNKDTADKLAMPVEQYIRNGSGLFVPVSATDPLPVGVGNFPATQNVAEKATIDTIIAAPVTGVKTIIATAAQIFAGASVRANRRKLAIKNEHPSLRLRIGPSSVTQQNGFPVEPGATVILNFDPTVATAIFAISEGASLTASVMEV
ncbi:MAG: hypothetical protein ACYDDN_03825 [Candidatus Desulforudaceae bacterium]